ncbi:hypothetical protein POM88_041992 [Heracleum sosnowskyi]|uniref:Uncharacterized protein n=1 Tax=Heracleum sosnowskyi TaxID=360622 RepID=A0AAD8HH81_9APIA|nr:hypothetical protein POM88_041992 [Heracleum sosnowskyi]
MYQEKLAGMFTEVMRQRSSSLCFSDKETSGIASVKWFIVVVIVFATINVAVMKIAIGSLRDLAETWEVMQSAKGRVRKLAEENLKQFSEQNLSGLILKSASEAKEQNRIIELFERWLSLDVAVIMKIKTYLLQSLFSPWHDASSTASQVIAKVTSFELSLDVAAIGSLLLNIHLATC